MLGLAVVEEALELIGGAGTPGVGLRAREVEEVDRGDGLRAVREAARVGHEVGGQGDVVLIMRARQLVRVAQQRVDVPDRVLVVRVAGLLDVKLDLLDRTELPRALLDQDLLVGLGLALIEGALGAALTDDAEPLAA